MQSLKLCFWNFSEEFNDSEKYSLFNICRKCRLQDFIENNATYINKKPKYIWYPGKKQDIFGGYSQDVTFVSSFFQKMILHSFHQDQEINKAQLTIQELSRGRAGRSQFPSLSSTCMCTYVLTGRHAETCIYLSVAPASFPPTFGIAVSFRWEENETVSMNLFI